MTTSISQTRMHTTSGGTQRGTLLTTRFPEDSALQRTPPPKPARALISAGGNFNAVPKPVRSVHFAELAEIRRYSVSSQSSESSESSGCSDPADGSVSPASSDPELSGWPDSPSSAESTESSGIDDFSPPRMADFSLPTPVPSAQPVRRPEPVRASRPVETAEFAPDRHGIPAGEFRPHVWEGLSAVLQFGYFPYDGVAPAALPQTPLCAGPALQALPAMADGFRRYLGERVALTRQMGWHDEARRLERIAEERVVLRDGRMLFSNGTKLAFHEMPQRPGCQPLVAVNFAGMSATRVDAAGTLARYLGDIPSSLRQVRHVVQSVVSQRPTPNTELVELMGDYLRSRPESFFAYGHSMGGSLSRQLSDHMLSGEARYPAMPPKPVPFMAFQPCVAQVAAQTVPRQKPADDAARGSGVQSPQDPVGRLQRSSAFRRITRGNVEPPIGRQIDVLRDTRATPLQQHNHVYRLLAEDLPRKPDDLRAMLEQMQQVYAHGARTVPKANGPSQPMPELSDGGPYGARYVSTARIELRRHF